MLRVISGSARNLKLKTPDGLDTRPTTDRIKETLFNILQGDIPGSIVIDFFAGSGSIGIEALSRGADKAYFIDNGKLPYSCIVDNIKHTHFEDRSVVFNSDCIKASYQIHESHADLIFMDPPYNKNLERDLLSVLNKAPYVDRDTLFIIEADILTPFDYLDELGYCLVREKTYKTNKHIFARIKGD